jgi:hypothetical protein
MKETFRCEWVQCGRQCSGCPHGPYWYAYHREGQKVHKRYIGKVRPEPEPTRTVDPPHPWDAMFSRATASLALAYAIVGIGPATDRVAAVRRYRELQMAWHPDRGGDLRRAMHLNCAWEYIRSTRGW